jgi:hypothetical protein
MNGRELGTSKNPDGFLLTRCIKTCKLDQMHVGYTAGRRNGRRNSGLFLNQPYTRSPKELPKEEPAVIRSRNDHDKNQHSMNNLLTWNVIHKSLFTILLIGVPLERINNGQMIKSKQVQLSYVRNKNVNIYVIYMYHDGDISLH